MAQRVVYVPGKTETSAVSCTVGPVMSTWIAEDGTCNGLSSGSDNLITHNIGAFVVPNGSPII